MKPHAPLRRSEMTATCFPRDESHTHKMQQKRQATEKYTHFDISYIIIQDKKTHRHGCADKQSECKHLTLTAVTSMWGQEGASGGGALVTQLTAVDSNIPQVLERWIPLHLPWAISSEQVLKGMHYSYITHSGENRPLCCEITHTAPQRGPHSKELRLLPTATWILQGLQPQATSWSWPWAQGADPGVWTAPISLTHRLYVEGTRLVGGEGGWHRKVTSLLCQAKGDTAGSCPQNCVSQPREDLVRSFIAMFQGQSCW